MVNDDKRDLRAKVFADPRYRKHWLAVASFMARSRELRNEPGELLVLQAEMLSALVGMQESKAALERDLAEHADRERHDVVEVEVGLGVAKRLAHVIKQIGDGIAWRALSYDRAVIYALADKPQTGHVEPQSAIQELGAAGDHVDRTGNIVVVNDLTNFLRYGDYTSVGSRSVTVAECKGGKAARRSRRAKRQRRGLDEVLEFLNTGVRSSGDGSQVLLRHTARAKTHLGTVAELIREARQKGAANARLSRCLAVDVHYVELLAEITDLRKMHKLFHNPFHQTREAVSHHSLAFFDQFSRNVAPYSIYPFSDEDCTDVMTGAMWLVSHFSHRNLARCLKRRGLSVSLPDDTELRDYLALPIGERRHAEDRVAMRVWRSGESADVLIYLATTARLFAEFLDEESFADAIEELLSRQHLFEWDEGSVVLVPAFANEADLWD